MWNNEKLPVSKQLREWLVHIREKILIHRSYYSESNEKIFELKKGTITRNFAKEGKYQTHSPKLDPKEKCSSFGENAILISPSERTVYKIDK